MSDKKISQLTAATTPLTGAEVIPIVQSGSTVKVPVSNLFENASSTKTGLLSSTDWSTFNNKAGTSSPTFSGNVALSTGNLVIGTAGKGIDFSATSDGSGTANSELLADYEEGTFTPAYSPASGAFTSITVSSVGRYVKIGSVVYFWIDIRTTAATTLGTASGTLYITGLPYTSSSSGGYACVSIFQSFNLGTAITNLQSLVEASSTRLYLTKNNSNSGVGYVQATELTTGSGSFNNLLGIFGCYRV